MENSHVDFSQFDGLDNRPFGLRIKKLVPEAIIPKYQTPGAAGFDLTSIEDAVLYPGKRHIVGTGLAFDIPFGFEMQIRPRSGLAAKLGITIVNAPGTIDCDYIDEVKIILLNTQIPGAEGSTPFVIKAGDRIAQAVLAPVTRMIFIEVEEFDELAKNKDRGGGFGSTGVR